MINVMILVMVILGLAVNIAVLISLWLFDKRRARAAKSRVQEQIDACSMTTLLNALEKICQADVKSADGKEEGLIMTVKSIKSQAEFALEFIEELQGNDKGKRK